MRLGETIGLGPRPRTIDVFRRIGFRASLIVL
jgi:hypothetical protein